MKSAFLWNETNKLNVSCLVGVAMLWEMMKLFSLKFESMYFWKQVTSLDLKRVKLDPDTI